MKNFYHYYKQFKGIPLMNRLPGQLVKRLQAVPPEYKALYSLCLIMAVRLLMTAGGLIMHCCETFKGLLCSAE